MENIELTGIEIRFLKHIFQDKTLKEIAAEMKKDPRTIDGYRDRLLKKLNCKSRYGLMLYAIKNGLVIL